MKFLLTSSSGRSPTQEQETALKNIGVSITPAPPRVYNWNGIIRITSLKKLVTVTEILGKIIVSGDSIEIYDDWRE